MQSVIIIFMTRESIEEFILDRWIEKYRKVLRDQSSKINTIFKNVRNYQNMDLEKGNKIF